VSGFTPRIGPNNQFGVYSGRLSVERREVVWRFDPDIARMLADALEDGTSPDDMARHDAAALRAAAERAEDR
jgi:hypothetical protein